MILSLLKNLRHGRLSHYQKFWVFWGSIYRKIILLFNYQRPCKKKYLIFGPFNFHPIFFFSDYENWGSDHNSFYNKMIQMSINKSCVIDIGAHIGLTLIPISRVSSGQTHIHCFEPSDTNFKFLNYHIKKNSLKNIILNRCLVGASENDNVIFYEKKNHSGLNSIAKLDHKGKFFKVKKTQINLDIYCRRKGISPDIIKIDAEGSEIEILKGAKTIIIKYKPIIFLSLHPYHIKKIGNDIHDLSSILSEIKYDIIDKNNNIPKSFKLDEYLLIPKYDKSIKKFVRNYF